MDYRLEDPLDAATAAQADLLIAAAPNGHFTQHPAWAQVPSGEATGRWTMLVAREGGAPAAAALVRLRRVPGIGYTLADVFRGPAARSAGTLIETVRALPDLLAPMRPLAIRIDPFWSGPEREQVAAGLAALGYAATTDPQWSSRSLEVDIDREPEELLRAFSADARGNVRKALRMNIEVREGLEEASFDALDALYRRMAATKDANPRPAGFFQGIGRFCRAWPRRGFLLTSWMDSEILGAIVVFTLGRRAIYAYGASSTALPKVPKSHLLQYVAMQRARALGCAVYDMGGFGAGAGEGGGQTRVQRINYFKSGFGGSPIDFVPSQELIVRPRAYRMVRSIHRLVAAARSRRAAAPVEGMT